MMSHPSQIEVMHLFPTQFLTAITACFYKAKQESEHLYLPANISPICWGLYKGYGG